MTFCFSLRRPGAALLLAGLLAHAGCGGGDSRTAAGTPSDNNNTSTSAAALPAASSAPGEASARNDTGVELVGNGSFGLGLSQWATDDATLVPSTQRPGGQMLSLGGTATHRFAAGQLRAGYSYTLVVKARLVSEGSAARVSLRFHRPGVAGAGEVIRDHGDTVRAPWFQDLRVDFTAPPYPDSGELVITAGNTRVLVDSVSLQQRAPIEPTEAVWTHVGTYAPPGYVLAFNDEFNGPTLNRGKWFTRYIFANGTLDRLNDEKQRYRDNDNHVIRDGVLNLVARKVSSNDPEGINYESGMLRSDWTAREGYFEARVKMPRGVGMWPAFWLASDVGANGKLAWPPEIDIFEFVNNGIDDTRNMLHSGVVQQPIAPSALLWADPDFNEQWTYWRAPFNFDDGWHTVGAEWTATSVTMYVDGRRIYTRSIRWVFPDGSPAGPAHILLNLAVGGAWAGRYGIDDSAFPQALQIEWVRAYRKAD